VAYATVAQLGYALLGLGLLLHPDEPRLHAALGLFVLAHGLAKVSMFLAAGELQSILGSRRVRGMKGASQNVPIALAAFAVAGGSLIGLPPSGGFLAKWLMLQPLFERPQHWPWGCCCSRPSRACTPPCGCSAWPTGWPRCRCSSPPASCRAFSAASG